MPLTPALRRYIAEPPTTTPGVDYHDVLNTTREATAPRSNLLRSSALDLFGHTILVLLHGRVEHVGELVQRGLVSILVLPRRVEKLVGDTGNLGWDLQVEDWVRLVFGFCELSVVNGVDDRTSVFERATLALGRGESALDPTGVDEVAIGAVLLHTLGEHRRVTRWVADDERLTEASGEDGGGFGDAVFGTGSLGRVTGDEVVRSLSGRKL